MSSNADVLGGRDPSPQRVEVVPATRVRLALGIVLGVLCALFLWGSIDQGLGNLEDVGAGAFPAVIAGIGLLSSIAVIIEALARRGDARLWVEKPPATSLRRMAAFTFGVALFPLLVRPAGFLPAAWVTTIIVMRAAGQRSWLRAVVYSLIFAAALFYVFVEILGMPLPRGSALLRLGW